MRDLIMDLMVVWEDGGRRLSFENVEDKDDKWGMIVIPMYTITNRKDLVNSIQMRERTALGQN